MHFDGADHIVNIRLITGQAGVVRYGIDCDSVRHHATPLDEFEVAEGRVTGGY